MKAVAIGELTVDWLSLEYGESMMTATKFYRYIGGNATNVAVGLARLGLSSAVISKVGDDIHGNYLLNCLRKENVDGKWVAIDPDQPTAQCYMTRRQDGFPDYYSWPSPNASKTLQPGDIDEESFAESWIWHAASVSFIAKPRRFAMQYAIEKAHERGKIISFDACFPLVESEGGRVAAWKAMCRADILRFNLAEIGYWSNMHAGDNVDAMVAEIRKSMSPAVLVITLAEKGAMVYSGSDKEFCPPYLVKSIGDVGPGDAFSAGMIYGLSTLGERGMTRKGIYDLKIDDWLKLCRFGACTGAMVTRSFSATESFPRLDELELALGETTPGS